MVEPDDAQKQVSDLADTKDTAASVEEPITAPAGTEQSRRVPFGWRALHILVLTSFAIAQPLFSVLGDGPEFFVAHDSATADILILALGVVLVPAMVLIGFEGIVYLVNRNAAWWVHLGFVGGLAMLILVPVIDRSGLNAALVLTLSAAGGLAAAMLYDRLSAARTFLSILGIAPLAFAGLFLFGTDVSKVAFPRAVAVTPIQVESNSPVILLILDELPAQTLMTADLEIDAGLFPNFARLANMSTWYRNAGTVDERTTQSVPSILTGQRAQGDDLLPALQDHPENLFTMLGDEYTMQAMEPVTALCPASLCTGDPVDPLGDRLNSLIPDTYAVFLNIIVPEDLRSGLPDVTRTWGDFAGGGLPPQATDSGDGAGDVYTEEPVGSSALGDLLAESQREDRGGQFEEFVAAIDGQESTLYAAHALVPHMPWIYFPSGKIYEPNPIHVLGEVGLNEGFWRTEEWTIAPYLQRHILQTMYVDRIVGDLLDRLEEEGTLDEAFVAITADHGISFSPGSRPRHATEENYWEILNVPLFLKLPFQAEGAISDANVDTIDIMPTIADVLNVEVPWDFDGQSLLDDDYRSDKTFGRPDREPLEVPGQRPPSLALLETKTQLLGPNPTVADVYAIGPHSDIVGQRVDSFILREPSGLEVRLKNADAIISYDPSQLIVPALLEGQVVGVEDGSSALDVAFAVNGTIQAVAHTFECCSTDFPFSAVLSEQLFEAGGPLIDAFRVHESDVGVELEPILTRTFVLDYEAGAIIGSDGVPITVSDGAINGTLEVADVEGGDVSLNGWAADLDRGINAESILVFRNDELVLAAGLNAPRNDVAEYFEVPELTESNSGFRFSIRGLAGEMTQRDELRIFAVVDNLASELTYPEDYAWLGRG